VTETVFDMLFPVSVMRSPSCPARRALAGSRRERLWAPVFSRSIQLASLSPLLSRSVRTSVVPLETFTVSDSFGFGVESRIVFNPETPSVANTWLPPVTGFGLATETGAAGGIDDGGGVDAPCTVTAAVTLSVITGPGPSSPGRGSWLSDSTSHRGESSCR